MLSVVLTGGLIVVALDTIGAAAKAQAANGDSSRAQLLALALMSEILDANYADPNKPGTVFGPEPGEADGTRKNFDDVDDYNSWTDAPMADPDGVAIPNFPSGWGRSSTVHFVNATDLSTKTVKDYGVKKINVVVWKNGKALAALVGLRTGDAVGPNTIIAPDPDPVLEMVHIQPLIE